MTSNHSEDSDSLLSVQLPFGTTADVNVVNEMAEQNVARCVSEQDTNFYYNAFPPSVPGIPNSTQPYTASYNNISPGMALNSIPPNQQRSNCFANIPSYNGLLSNNYVNSLNIIPPNQGVNNSLPIRNLGHNDLFRNMYANSHISMSAPATYEAQQPFHSRTIPVDRSIPVCNEAGSNNVGPARRMSAAVVLSRHNNMITYLPIVGGSTSELPQIPNDEMTVMGSHGDVTSSTSTGKRKTTYQKYIYSKAQLSILNKEYANCKFITKERRQELATQISVSASRIKVWFKNKRQTEKRKLE